MKSLLDECNVCKDENVELKAKVTEINSNYNTLLESYNSVKTQIEILQDINGDNSSILEKKETHQTEINHKESNQELLHVNKVPTTSKIVKLPEAINSQNSKSYYSISENNYERKVP